MVIHQGIDFLSSAIFITMKEADTQQNMSNILSRRSNVNSFSGKLFISTHENPDVFNTFPLNSAAKAARDLRAGICSGVHRLHPRPPSPYFLILQRIA
jgi:hypothetical protein